MKYYEAYNAIRTENPKQNYKEDYDAIVNQVFDNAYNIVYNEVEFEYEYGSNVFEKVEKVRIDSIVNYTSSMVVDSEDFKTFIFLPDFPEPLMGMKFKWNGSYWLVISTNNKESLTTTAEVRRCNNVLRYYDKYGNKIYEPCIIDTTLRFTKNITTYPISIGSNEEKIWCQRNDRTAMIKENDRFLFGHPKQRICFRVYGAGTKNILNTTTMDDTSPSLTEIYIQNYQINEAFDDLENGFANAYSNNFEIVMDDFPTTYNVGDTGVFKALVYKSKELFDADIMWTSSNDEIIKVEKDGSYEVLKEGNVTITVSMVDNNAITTSVELKVEDISIENYDIVITPNINYILQGDTKTFECYLYKNGQKQDNVFVFLDVSVGVPKNNYLIEKTSDNSFTLTNKLKYLNSSVQILCKTEGYEKTISVLLRGLY